MILFRMQLFFEPPPILALSSPPSLVPLFSPASRHELGCFAAANFSRRALFSLFDVFDFTFFPYEHTSRLFGTKQWGEKHKTSRLSLVSHSPSCAKPDTPRTRDLPLAVDGFDGRRLFVLLLVAQL